MDPLRNFIPFSGRSKVHAPPCALFLNLSCMLPSTSTLVYQIFPPHEDMYALVLSCLHHTLRPYCSDITFSYFSTLDTLSVFFRPHRSTWIVHSKASFLPPCTSCTKIEWGSVEFVEVHPVSLCRIQKNAFTDDVLSWDRHGPTKASLGLLDLRLLLGWSPQWPVACVVQTRVRSPRNWKAKVQARESFGRQGRLRHLVACFRGSAGTGSPDNQWRGISSEIPCPDGIRVVESFSRQKKCLHSVHVLLSPTG